MPTWTILIATLGRRDAQRGRLLEALLPQVDAAGGAVSVEALWNHGERPVGQLRQELLEHASAQYVCFVDDDDMVPENYVAAILPLLDGVDYVGFNVVISAGPLAGTVARHSLKFNEWTNEPGSYLRAVSHLNPLRRELALRARFPSEDYSEDYAWALQVRPHVRTEHYLDEVMYSYSPAGELDARRSEPGGVCGSPVLPPKRVDSGVFARPVVTSPHFSWHPASVPEGATYTGVLL